MVAPILKMQSFAPSYYTPPSVWLFTVMHAVINSGPTPEHGVLHQKFNRLLSGVCTDPP